MNWLIAVIISTILVSFTSLVRRSLVDKNNSTPSIVYSTIIHILGGLITLSIVIFIPDYTLSGLTKITSILPSSTLSFILFVIWGVSYTLGQKLRFTSLKKLEASEFTNLFTVRVVATGILSYLFLSESLSISQTLAIVGIIASIFILNYKSKSYRLNKESLIAIATGILFAIGNVSDKFLLIHIDPLYSTLLYFLIIGSISFLSSLNNIKTYSKVIFSKQIIKLSGIALMQSLAAFLFLQALQSGNTTIVSAITATSSIITTVLGIVILKEKNNTWQKAIASTLSLGCLVMLTR
jgi:drug/metabolite transporter (DMT)-like permease